jgi:hypothetical protein
MDDVLGHAPVPLVDILGKVKGGNSTVYKCLGENGSLYAVKVLEGSDDRRQAAFSRQISATSVLKNSSILSPALVASNEDSFLLVYEWIEGIHPAANENLAMEIIRVVHELKKLFNSKTNLGLAADALQHVSSEIANIESRTIGLQKVSDKNVSDSWSAELISRLSWITHEYAGNEFNVDTYSFSDFGVHNILSINNNHFFIDTEFFGLDCSYKLLADLLLHPQNSFAPEVNLIFLEEISQLFGHDESNLKLAFQLLCLKWSTIVFKRFTAINISDMDTRAYDLAMQYLLVFDDLHEVNLHEGVFRMQSRLKSVRAK